MNQQIKMFCCKGPKGYLSLTRLCATMYDAWSSIDMSFSDEEMCATMMICDDAGKMKEYAESRGYSVVQVLVTELEGVDSNA